MTDQDHQDQSQDMPCKHRVIHPVAPGGFNGSRVESLATTKNKSNWGPTCELFQLSFPTLDEELVRPVPRYVFVRYSYK